MKCYVALDIGNVLCRIDFKKFTSAISKQVNITIWEAGHRINLHQKMNDVGLITMPEILEVEFGIKSSAIIEELLNIWNNDIIKFDDNVIDFFKQISYDNELNIALLSNVGTDHAAIINKYIDQRYSHNYAYMCFKSAIKYYSCDVGARKPQSLYYQSFLSQYPRFEGCVYLDDRQENLQASLKYGFEAIEFDLEKLQDVNAQLQAIKDLILAPYEEPKNSRRH